MKIVRTFALDIIHCVIENRMLRKIFGGKRDEVLGGWRRLHNEEFHNLYTLQNVVRVIRSRRMRQAGHVACIEVMRNLYKISIGKTFREETTWKA
jgi:hypothetical protein